jgi:hypothetical protein
MTYKFMADPVSGKAAVFLENGTSGLFDDPTATRNAPLLLPASYMANLKFHSDLDHLAVADAGNASITHASIAGLTSNPLLGSNYGTNAGGDDNLLFTHNLGYVPFALAYTGTNIIWPGMPVQTVSGGGARYATVYANTTQLRVATQTTIGTTTLPSVAITYNFLIFANPPAASGNVLYSFDPSTGKVTMGFGKFDSTLQYLQVVPGGSPLGLSMGRTIDLANGAPHACRPDGTTYEPVPAALAFIFEYLSYSGGDFGGETSGHSLAYNGSFASPSIASVQAP